jgi:hypothetical protein
MDALCYSMGSTRLDGHVACKPLEGTMEAPFIESWML